MVDISPQLARLFREELIVIDGSALKRPPLSQISEVCTAIDEMGRRSGIAQGLKGPNGSVAPVTISFKLAGSNERLYILANGDSPRQLVGILKMGRKNLYHYDARGTMHQLQDQHAVLDFYVHEAFQRNGVGLSLFQAMLEHEETSPEMLAYDRPSPKLIVRSRSHLFSRATAPPRPCLLSPRVKPALVRLTGVLAPAFHRVSCASTTTLPSMYHSRTISLSSIASSSGAWRQSRARTTRSPTGRSPRVTTAGGSNEAVATPPPRLSERRGSPGR